MSGNEEKEGLECREALLRCSRPWHQGFWIAGTRHLRLLLVIFPLSVFEAGKEVPISFYAISVS